MNDKKTGGRRRVKLEDKRIGRSISLRPRDWEKLDVLSESTERSRSRWVEKQIEAAGPVATEGGR